MHDFDKYKVNHVMKLTMINEKVCQALTRMASSALCCICGTTPSEMNNFKKLAQKTEAEKNFEFELSTLHAWTRFIECILDTAYRLQSKNDQRGRMNRKNR